MMHASHHCLTALATARLRKATMMALVAMPLSALETETAQSQETMSKRLAESEGCFHAQPAAPYRINRLGYDFTAYSLAGDDCIYYLLVNSDDGVALFANWFFAIAEENRQLLYVRLASCSSPNALRPCDCTDFSPCYWGQSKPRPRDLFLHGLSDTTVEWSSLAHASDYVEKPVSAYVGLFKGERGDHFVETYGNDRSEQDAEEQDSFQKKLRDAIMLEKISGFLTSAERTVGPIQIEFSSQVLPEEEDVIAYIVTNNSKEITLQVAAPEVAQRAHNDGFVGLAWEPMWMRYGPNVARF